MDEGKILQKLVEHDGRFERIEYRLDQFATKREFNDRLDEMMVILKRLDQERVFTSEWIKRIESEVEQHTKDLSKLKEHLGIS
jgi:DNA repair exonuclease SbcCD ATPase subunit